MMNNSSKVWLNGCYTDEGIQIAANDRGFLIGDGVFETLLIKEAAPVFLKAHLARLSVGLKALRIPRPEFDETGSIFRELTRLNGLENTEAVGRLTITRGVGARGLAPSGDASKAPTVLVTVSVTPVETKKCLKLHLTQRIRDSRSIASAFKSLSGYVENQAARFEAADAECDEALLVNAVGRIACAATANVFMIGSDGVVHTPPASEGAMPGVVRNLLLNVSAAHGIAVEEMPIEPEQLSSASGIFLTNSLIGVRQAHIKGEASAPNEIVAKLADIYKIEIEKDLSKRRLVQ